MKNKLTTYILKVFLCCLPRISSKNSYIYSKRSAKAIPNFVLYKRRTKITSRVITAICKITPRISGVIELNSLHRDVHTKWILLVNISQILYIVCNNRSHKIFYKKIKNIISNFSYKPR